MSVEMNEILELLNKISISDSPKQLLTDLKITLTGLQHNNLESLPGINDLNVLFDTLNSSDHEQVELCVDVLSRLLPLLDSRIIVEQLPEHILRGFSHPCENVRCLSLKQVQSCAQTPNGIQVLLSNKPLILGTVGCVGDDSLTVVNIATSTITVIASSSAGVATMFSNEAVTAFEGVMAKSDSCRFNVYEVITKVCLLHDEALAIVSNSGLLDRLIGEVTTGDILTQLNALEMLTTLAINPAGLALLQQAGVVSKLEYLLSMTESDPLASMLLPGLLKFFGNLGYAQPLHLAENFRNVFLLLLKMCSGGIESVDPFIEMVAFETVTHVGHSLEGKYALMKFNNEMNASLNYFGYKMRNSPVDMKARILDSFSHLIILQTCEQMEDILVVTQSWWTEFIGGRTLEKFVPHIKQPFPELHLAALTILIRLVSLPWGQQLVADEPGLCEYLLDRNTEHAKKGKELRWDIFKIILETSPKTDKIFSDNHLEKIRTYYKNGPFYVVADPQIAYAEDT